MDYCINKNAELLTRLKGPQYAASDVEEFVNCLQTVQVVLNRLAKIRDPNLIDYTEGMLDSVKSLLDIYGQKLDELEKQKRILRFFTSQRLRKQIDKLNSSLILQVSEFEHEVTRTIGGAYNEPRSRDPNYMQIPEKAQPAHVNKYDMVWEQLFGIEKFVVKWDEFIKGMKKFVVDLDSKAEAILKEILDHGNTSSVNRFKFTEFMKGFGPLSSSVKNAVSIYNSPWFHGYITKEEAEKLLFGEPIGTYLIRFSSSKPGSFAIEYIGIEEGEVSERYGAMPALPPQGIEGNLSVLSVLVDSCDEGFQVKENQTKKAKIFKGLLDIIEYYYAILLIPFSTTLFKESWFHGDLSADEAEELLIGQPEGTFLIRFSSQPGYYASSFVGPKGKIGKSLIKKLANGYKVENSTSTTIYPDLNALVKSYHAFFLYPFKNEVGMIRRRQTLQADSRPKSPTVNQAVRNWTVDDVANWLETIGLSEYKSTFTGQKINGLALKELSDEDLKRELKISALGHRKLILKSIKEL